MNYALRRTHSQHTQDDGDRTGFAGSWLIVAAIALILDSSFEEKVELIKQVPLEETEEMTMAIADKNGIPRTTLYNRIRAGWDLEKAISEPSKKTVSKRDIWWTVKIKWWSLSKLISNT